MKGWACGFCLIALAALLPAAAADEADTTRLTADLAAAEARDGGTSPSLLPVIDALAEAQWRDGALDRAAALRRRALGIAIAAFGCDSAKAADAMTALALVEIDRRHYLDAEALLIAARQALGEDDTALAPVLAGLARVALARGDTDAADAWATKAVAFMRRQPQPGPAEPLRALGAALAAADRFDAAEAALIEALTQDRRQFGADSSQTARSQSQLANLYFREDRAADALPLIEKATSIDQRKLGPTHPLIADDLYDLGQAYEALHRQQEARDAFIAARKLLESGDGRETPRVAYVETELAKVYRAQGDAAAADTASGDARRILKKAEAEERKRERRV